MNNSIVVLMLGEDRWGRNLYRNVSTGSIYAMVDDRLHTTTEDGEPDCPLKKDLDITFV